MLANAQSEAAGLTAKQLVPARHPQKHAADRAAIASWAMGGAGALAPKVQANLCRLPGHGQRSALPARTTPPSPSQPHLQLCLKGALPHQLLVHIVQPAPGAGAQTSCSLLSNPWRTAAGPAALHSTVTRPSIPVPSQQSTPNPGAEHCMPSAFVAPEGRPGFAPAPAPAPHLESRMHAR